MPGPNTATYLERLLTFFKTAASVSYDNTESGLDATDVQAAIDEVAADAVTPSDAPPTQVQVDPGSPGFDTAYSRADHLHQLVLPDFVPATGGIVAAQMGLSYYGSSSSTDIANSAQQDFVYAMYAADPTASCTAVDEVYVAATGTDGTLYEQYFRVKGNLLASAVVEFSYQTIWSSTDSDLTDNPAAEVVVSILPGGTPLTLRVQNLTGQEIAAVISIKRTMIAILPVAPT